MGLPRPHWQGLESWLSSHEHSLLFQRIGLQFLEPTSGKSQPSVTLMPSSGLQGYGLPTHSTHTHTSTHMHTPSLSTMFCHLYLFNS